MLGRAFALPGAQAPFGFALRRGAAGQQLKRVAAQILHGSVLAAREDELYTIARGEVGKLGELHSLREVLQLRRRLLLMQRELGERFAAILPPGDAD
jgi:hypothetical protein